MIQKIKIAILSLALSFGFAAPVLVPAVASAAVDTTNTINQGLCTGVGDASGGSNTSSSACFNNQSDTTDSLSKIAKVIINIFSIIVGIVAIIMIIYGGFRYITSGGESGRVGNAKNTLIYAIVGLIIVALAQFLVHFVLTTATTSVQ
jgi:predicted permease